MKSCWLLCAAKPRVLYAFASVSVCVYVCLCAARRHASILGALIWNLSLAGQFLVSECVWLRLCTPSAPLFRQEHTLSLPDIISIFCDLITPLIGRINYRRSIRIVLQPRKSHQRPLSLIGRTLRFTARLFLIHKHTVYYSSRCLHSMQSSVCRSSPRLGRPVVRIPCARASSKHLCASHAITTHVCETHACRVYALRHRARPAQRTTPSMPILRMCESV